MPNQAENQGSVKGKEIVCNFFIFCISECVYSTIAKRVNGKHLLSLDDHMLLNIFEYLDLKSLLSLCRVNRRLCELIKSHRIGQETIVLETDENGDPDSTILDILPNTTKLSIAINIPNYNRTLRMISTHCSDGKLKEIRIDVRKTNYNWLSIINNLIDRSRNHFLREKLKNVERLAVYTQHNGIDLDVKLTTLFIVPNLISISLDNLGMTKNCLNPLLALKNLRKLELKFCRHIPYQRFSEIMTEIGGRLTSFTWDTSAFPLYENQNRIYSLVKETLPNINELCLKESLVFSEYNANQTVLDNLLELTKLQSFTFGPIDHWTNTSFNSFLKRLCSLRPITKLDFTWEHMFTSSDEYFDDDEETIAECCEYLLDIQNLRLGCDFSRMDWNAFKVVLLNLREFRSLRRIDFESKENRDRFKLLLQYGLKLIRVTLVEICKSNRDGKGITIHVWNTSEEVDSLRKLPSYDSKYVRFVWKW